MKPTKLMLCFLGVVMTVLTSGCGKGDPKGAVIALGEAMKRGDAATVKAGTINVDPRAIDMMAAMVGSTTKLHDAAVAKFGNDGSSFGDSHMPNIGEQMADADVKIDGDDATVTPKTGQALKLKKVSGEWKVDFAQLPGMTDMASAMPMMQAMSDANSQLADEIAAGKYATAADAKKAGDEKMMSAFSGEMGKPQAGALGGAR